MDGKENKDLLTSTNFTFYFSDEMSSFIKKNLIQKKKKKKEKKKAAANKLIQWTSSCNSCRPP